MSRSFVRRVAPALALGVAALTGAPRAGANPNEGEARTIVRDADRPYTVVAGEGDGASTVTNPANLGYLRGLNGIADFALMSPDRRRRGSGLGLFLGMPLPLRLFSLGLGYQLLLPYQPESATGDNGMDDPTDPNAPDLDPDPQGVDDRYHKVTFAVAVPVASWVRVFRPGAKGLARALDGLSLGMSYSRMVSASNFHAHGTRQLDVAISYWPSRYVALGLVGRAINLPRTGRNASGTTGATVQSAEVHPEVAIRPLGTPALELAVGSRIRPVFSESDRFRSNAADPGARLFVSAGGVRFFAEAELMRFNPVVLEDGEAAARIGARLNAGVELNFRHFGIAAAPLMSAGARTPYGVDGGAVRLRVSQEGYPSLASRPRVVTKLALAHYSGDRGMWAAVEELEAAAERRGVVLVETRGMGLGYAQLEELREAMLRVRNRGGKVVAYLDGGTLRSYFLASAADRIIAHPHAGLEILGMRIQRLYYGELLTRLGAEPEFVRVAEYKGWPETVHRDTASEPVARQRHLLYTDVWNHVLRMVARERGQDPRVVKEWIDAAPLGSEDALRRGLVDALAFPDELDAEIEDWLGRKIRIEAPSEAREHRRDYGPPPRVVVLVIEGDLVQGDSFTVPLIGRKVAGDRTLTKEVERLRKDPSVRAVVVRIDSPGGDVWTADAIARELDLLRKEKPVVVSMGNTCASGGYYIATAGQYIYADATTFTGSIGVFYPKVDISGTLDKIGVSVDEEDFGAHAGMRSWLRGYDEDELAAAQADVERTYLQFLQRVADARSMTLEQADRVARGRVWSGVRAIDEGLVDDYGGVREAILRARAIAGLRPDEGIVEVMPGDRGPLENLRALFGFEVPSPLAREGYGAAVPAAMALRSVVPAGMLAALRHLPLALWWGGEPRMMALGDAAYLVQD